jgi:AcrR family transcriptional regulator
MYHISNDKRSKQSSQWIIESLLQMMAFRSLDEITITSLCDHAKIGRVTFYRHFDSIDDVLQKSCDDRFDELSKYLDEFYQRHSASEPFLRPFLRFWYTDSQIIEGLIKNHKQEVIMESFLRMLGAFSQKHDVSEKPLTAAMDRYQQTVRVAVAIAVLTEWIRNRKNIAPDELASTIISAMKQPFELKI